MAQLIETIAHVPYANFVLANEIEDQFNSHLDLQNFCTVDNSLVGTPGMTKKINVYSATSGTEDLQMGYGNSKDIIVSYTPEDYTIKLAQNRFSYFDEQAMTDPMVVTTGVRHMATDMFNHVNDDIFTEFNNASLSVTLSGTDYFGAFCDAAAKLNVENLEGLSLFAFVAPDDVAKIRKALKDDLKYVEAFVKTGYIGTVAGWNLYTKKDATPGTIVGGTKEAVTLFVKKGTEVEQDRVGDNRKNVIWSRKYYIAALTDATKAVKIS